jgi:hypothetical protein
MTTVLRYETTAADQLAKLERFTAESIVARRFVWFAYVAISGLAWLSAVLFYVKQGDRSRGYLVYGAFAAVLTVSLPWLYGWYQGTFWRSVLTVESLRGVIGPTTLTVGEDFVEEAGPVTTARAEWRDVLRVDRGPARTFIFLAPLIAIAIPVSAFPNEAARLQFEQMILARFEVSRPKSQDPPSHK